MATAKPPLGVMIRAHLLADPRKTAVLVILALVMLGVYAKVLFKPKEAVAEAPVNVLPTNPADAANPTAAENTQERVVVNRPVIRDLPRDPFMSAYGFASPTAAENGSEKAELVLQSVICGAAPMACINGTFLQPGQKINGFVLRQVENTYVVLQQGDATVQLPLSN